MQKTTVSSVRNVGFSVKKRQFLKSIRVFVCIKFVYYADCQSLLRNDKNKRFLSPTGNASAIIGCMSG